MWHYKLRKIKHVPRFKSLLRMHDRILMLIWHLFVWYGAQVLRGHQPRMCECWPADTHAKAHSHMAAAARCLALIASIVHCHRLIRNHFNCLSIFSFFVVFALPRGRGPTHQLSSKSPNDFTNSNCLNGQREQCAKMENKRNKKSRNGQKCRSRREITANRMDRSYFFLSRAIFPI